MGDDEIWHLQADFTNKTNTEFKLQTKIEGRGKTKTGKHLGLRAFQILTFRIQVDQWVLIGWDQKYFHLERASQLLFREVLDKSVRKPEDLENARRSFHNEIMVETSRVAERQVPGKYLKWSTATANHMFPSVSVVDYNDDGNDDLF